MSLCRLLRLSRIPSSMSLCLLTVHPPLPRLYRILIWKSLCLLALSYRLLRLSRIPSAMSLCLLAAPPRLLRLYRILSLVVNLRLLAVPSHLYQISVLVMNLCLLALPLCLLAVPPRALRLYQAVSLVNLRLPLFVCLLAVLPGPLTDRHRFLGSVKLMVKALQTTLSRWVLDPANTMAVSLQKWVTI